MHMTTTQKVHRMELIDTTATIVRDYLNENFRVNVGPDRRLASDEWAVTTWVDGGRVVGETIFLIGGSRKYRLMRCLIPEEMRVI